MPFNPPNPQLNLNPEHEKKNSSGVSTYMQAEKLFQIAALLPTTTFVGWLGGSWLDRHLHQSWISIAGLLVGGIAGLAYVIRLAMAASQEAGREDQ